MHSVLTCTVFTDFTYQGSSTYNITRFGSEAFSMKILWVFFFPIGILWGSMELFYGDFHGDLEGFLSMRITMGFYGVFSWGFQWGFMGFFFMVFYEVFYRVSFHGDCTRFCGVMRISVRLFL